MLDHGLQRREAAVVVEAPLRPGEQAPERRGPVRLVRPRSAWNESMPISSGGCRVHPGSVNIGGTWQLAHWALPLNIAWPRSPQRARSPRGRRRHRNRDLIDVQIGQLGGDEIRVAR